MKVGIVCYPTLGGSGIVATELGHELAERGHEVHFITYQIPFRLELQHPNIHFHAVEINQYDLFKYPDYALTLAVKMANVAQEHDLDILHVHYAIPHATSAYLAKHILGKKRPAVITTLHGTDITLVGKDPAYFQIVKFSIEQSCGVTAVSQSLRSDTEKAFGIEKPIEVIYNFFTADPKLLGKKPLRGQYAPNGEKVLIHSSNYRSVKRPQDVLEVFLRVRKEIPSKLLLLGSGAGLEELRRVVQKEDVGDDVVFIGENRLIDPYVASCDLFLLPSAHESFGMAALEAMAYGVPAIASDVGGLPELIQNGKTGYLCPVGDVDTMAERAVELLQDESKYAEFSHAACIDACDRFCSSKIIPQYVALYERALEGVST